MNVGSPDHPRISTRLTYERQNITSTGLGREHPVWRTLSPVGAVGTTDEAVLIADKFASSRRTRYDGHLLQTPFQPCPCAKPNGEVCGRQHGDHPEECPLRGRGSMQVPKTAKHKKACQREQSSRDAQRHQGSTISNDLLRIIQLLFRHGLALAHFMHHRFDAAYFFAYRKRCSVPQPFHIYSGKGGEHQRQRKED